MDLAASSLASTAAAGHVALAAADWRDPVEAAGAFADEPDTVLLLSDGAARGRWSYLMRAPERAFRLGREAPENPWPAAARLLGGGGATDPSGPPFQGGLAGLASYEAGARSEPAAGLAATSSWPDLSAGLYLALLAFDHLERRVIGVGRGRDERLAAARAAEALGWLDHPAPPTRADVLASEFRALRPEADYEAAVAEVVERIAAGELFQANIARSWGGRLAPGATPFDAFARLAATSPAGFMAYVRMPGAAVVSNSPERFLRAWPDGQVETRPIKGTRPRGATPEADARLAAELLASRKDAAENLMIVDLMRNDLSRVCPPGAVNAPALFELESFANVHHLVSTVVGKLQPGRGVFDLMAAAFPPGSVTGAPKVQAMRVIRRFEAVRGPYCGSIFWAGFDGAMDSNVLIRTIACVEDEGGWRFEARAGAGVVAESEPQEECAEAEAKIAAIARALQEPAP